MIKSFLHLCRLPLLSYIGWLMASVFTTQGYAEHRERVTVAEPTRIDWTFAIAKQRIAHPPPEWVGIDYDSAQQTYELYGPDKNEGGNESYPLVLYLSPHDAAKGWQRWSPVCRRYNTIFAAPHNAGKKRSIARRIRIALDVLDDVRRKYSIDPDRTYLCGFLDGAHIACEIGYSLPEYFGGIIAIGGGEILPKELWLRHQVANRLSVAFIRSSREELKRDQFFFNVFQRSVSWSGTRTELQSYSGSPRQIPDSDVLAKALRWAEAAAARRRQLASSFPSTRVGIDGPLSDELRAQQTLADAKQRLQTEGTVYAGLLTLEALCQKWPHVGVFQEAESILNEYEKSHDAWKDQRLSDRKAAFWAIESGFNTVRDLIHGHHRWQLKQHYSQYPEEHVELPWFKSRKAAHHIGINDAVYERATQASLRRLGARVGFDERNHVSSLDLSGTLVTRRQFERFKERLGGMGTLHGLDLSSTVMRGSVLSQVADLAALQAVNLSHTPTTNRDLAKLSPLDQLQFLALVGTDVSHLRDLGSLGELRVLLLGSTKVADKTLARLAGAGNLRQLSLYATRVTDKGVATVATLPNLRYLNLSSTRVTDKACTVIAASTTLEELLLDRTDITNVGLSELQPMNQLRRLSLRATDITDDGLLFLQRMASLRTLDVRQTRVTKQGAYSLSATLPGLRLRLDEFAANTPRESRSRLHTEAYLNRFEDQYRLKLLEYQKRYFGFSARTAAGI